MQEEVWIETLDGPAKPYLTAMVETKVNNNYLLLFYEQMLCLTPGTNARAIGGTARKRV